LKLTVACHPAFPPEYKWCYPFVMNCVGTISDGGADVGMILGKWFKVDKWMDAPDSEKCGYYELFTNVSVEAFAMADFVVLRPPHIRCDISKSDKLDIFNIECVWVEPEYRGRGIASDSLAALVRSCRDFVGVFTCDPVAIRETCDGSLEKFGLLSEEHNQDEYYLCMARSREFLEKAGFEHIPEDFQDTYAIDPTVEKKRPKADSIDVEFVEGPGIPMRPFRWRSQIAVMEGEHP
jgi:GNAT superfamily N-acetyltransferase